MSDTPTRTPGTIQRYIKRAQQILAAIPAESLAEPANGVRPIEAAVWMEQHAGGMRKPTFRQYKASLICYYEHLAQQYPDGQSEYQEGINRLRLIPSAVAAGRTELPDQTSSRKAKYVHIDDISTLGQHMLASASQWAPRAYVWLVAGIVCGLRPIEWVDAHLDNTMSNAQLHVANAKTTNGRGAGSHRTILVEPGWRLEYTEQHLRLLEEWLAAGGDFESYYDGCRLALYRAVRVLWPNDKRRRYSLYSGRHQFTANLKRAGMSKQGVAALLGHGSTETATRHYGKRRAGHGGLHVVPQLREIAPIATTTRTTPEHSL